MSLKEETRSQILANRAVTIQALKRMKRQDLYVNLGLILLAGGMSLLTMTMLTVYLRERNYAAAIFGVVGTAVNIWSLHRSVTQFDRDQVHYREMEGFIVAYDKMLERLD